MEYIKGISLIQWIYLCKNQPRDKVIKDLNKVKQLWQEANYTMFQNNLYQSDWNPDNFIIEFSNKDDSSPIAFKYIGIDSVREFTFRVTRKSSKIDPLFFEIFFNYPWLK
jgi:hypothetical protein